MANFSLTWNVAAGTYQQELYLKNKYSGSWNLIATLDGTTNTYNLTGIPDNKIQQFKVKAFCTDGFPKESPVSEFASLTCPSPVTVTPVCDGIVNYSFTQVGGDVNNYDIQLLSNADVVITTQTKAAAATVTGSFTGLTASTPYKIKVTSKADTITKACTSTSFTSRPDSPVVTTQPINQAACDDQTVTLTAVYNCVGCAFQWYKGTVALSNTGDFSGVTTQTLTIANAGLNVGTYKLKGTNDCAAVETNAVTITLLPDTTVSVEPSNNNVCIGATANFGVTAGGTNVTYQWQVSTDGGTTYANISGATSATYSFVVASGDNNKKYRTKVNSTCGPEITSLPGTLTTKTDVSISGQPANTTVCIGANASFTVTATGTGLTYQWQKKNGTNWENISGATSATLTVESVTAEMAGNKYRVVCAGDCNTVTSGEATLSTYVTNNITANPSDLSLCSGVSATFSVTAEGNALTYQWQVSTDGGSTWTNITDATSASLTFTTASGDNGKKYRCKVNGTCGGEKTSSVATLTIKSDVSISSQPVSATVCGTADVTFSVTATGTGLSRQWQKKINSVWTNLASETGATLTIANATAVADGAGTLYRVVCTGDCNTVTSDEVTYGFYTNASITSQPSNQLGCVDGNVTFSVTAAGSNLSYKWQENISSVWTDITGATVSSYTETTLVSGDNGRQFRVIVTGPCNSVTSNTVSISIGAVTTITQQPNNQSACDGHSATFTVVASGTNLSYQWQRESSGNWTNISGATSASYTLVVNATSVTYTYRVVVTGACGSETSTAASLSIASDAAVWTQRNIADHYVCVGVNKYYQEIDTNPCSATYNTTRTGSLYQSNSVDCGYVACPPVTNLIGGFEETAVVLCLDGLVIETIYLHYQSDVNLLPGGYTHPCPEQVGAHSCNSAFFEVFGNGVYIGDSKLNNAGGTGGTLSQSGAYICQDYNNTPSYLTGGTWAGSSSARYNRIVMTQAQAVAVAAAGTSGSNIQFSLQAGVTTYNTSCDGTGSPHSNVTWIRITKSDGTVLYNGCPQGNFTTIDVCTTAQP